MIGYGSDGPQSSAAIELHLVLLECVRRIWARSRSDNVLPSRFSAPKLDLLLCGMAEARFQHILCVSATAWWHGTHAYSPLTPAPCSQRCGRTPRGGLPRKKSSMETLRMRRMKMSTASTPLYSRASPSRRARPRRPRPKRKGSRREERCEESGPRIERALSCALPAADSLTAAQPSL